MRRKIAFLLLIMAVSPAFEVATVHASGSKEKKIPDINLVSETFKKEVAEKINEAGRDIDSFAVWAHGRYGRATREEQHYLNMMLFLWGMPVIENPILRQVGPITLVVEDNETGLPLKDITVYYRLEKGKSVDVQTIDFIALELEKLKTNNKGEVYIPARNYSLNEPWELLYSMKFYINLDTDDSRTPTERDIYHFNEIFSPSNSRMGDDIALANNTYYATCVRLYDKDKKTSDFSGNRFLLYMYDTPFSRRIKVTAKLARNTD